MRSRRKTGSWESSVGSKNFNPTGSKWPGAISEGSESTIGSRILRISHDFFFRPNLINHWTFGFNRYRSDTFPEAGVGWPGVLGYQGVPQTGPGSTFPTMDIGGLGATYARGAQGYGANNNFTIDENVSWIRSKHTIKAGFSYIKLQTNGFSSSYQSSYLTFSAGTTGLPDPRYFSDGCAAGGACTGIGVAGFLLTVQGDNGYHRSWGGRSNGTLCVVRARRFQSHSETHLQYGSALRPVSPSGACA